MLLKMKLTISFLLAPLPGIHKSDIGISIVRHFWRLDDEVLDACRKPQDRIADNIYPDDFPERCNRKSGPYM